jgi:hypothetical protein
VCHLLRPRPRNNTLHLQRVGRCLNKKERNKEIKKEKRNRVTKLCVTLFDLQLDAQNSYLHIIHLLKSSICFEHYPAHLKEVYVVIVCMQPLVSSLSAGNYLVHRLRKKKKALCITSTHIPNSIQTP